MTLPLTLLPSLYCFAAATYNTPSSPLHCKVQDIWNTFQSMIRKELRTRFFLPVTENLSAKLQKQLTKEIAYYQDFWDPTKPLDPLLTSQAEIRKQFTQRQESAAITVNNKTLEVGYTVIESKWDSKDTKNLVILLGNLSTLNNTIMYQYPFLDLYVKKVEEDPFTSPFRLICISQYATKQNGKMYMAETLDESGQILTETLKAIIQKKGPIESLVAHSIGSIILTAGLRHAKQANVLPLTICIDRTLSSVTHRSKLYGLVGKCALVFAKAFGWFINLGKQIKEHFSDRPNQTVYISEVLEDHLFPGECSLVQSRHLEKEIPGIKKFSFDFPAQKHNNMGHHGLHTGYLSGYHLVPRNEDVLPNDKTMTHLIMEKLFP